MARASQDVTEAELAILQALWDRGPATRRQLTDWLYPGGSPAHYTTVVKLLERLEAKGCVVYERTEPTPLIRPTIAREDLISRRLRAVADQLCEGSLTPLLTNLIRDTQLAPDEIQALRDLIDNLKQPARTKGKRRN